MRKGKLLLPLFVCCIVLTAGNCSQRDAGLLDFVPSDSTAILIADWSAVRNDNDLKSMVNGNKFEEQMRHFGIESGAVKEFTVFGAVNSQIKSALLLRGSFDRRKITEHLRSGGWNESSASGHKIYAIGNNYAALPASGVFIAGTREGVLAALHASENPRDSIQSAPSFKKIRTSMQKIKSPVAAFLIASEGTLETADAALSLTAGAMSLFGLGEIGAILKKLNVAGGAGFTVAHGSDSRQYAVNLCVLMRDEKTASLAAGTLNVMKNLSSMAATSSDAEKLRSFDISRQEKVISIKMEMPREMMQPPSER